MKKIRKLLICLIITVLFALPGGAAYAYLPDIPSDGGACDAPDGYFGTNYGSFEFMRNNNTHITVNQGTILEFLLRNPGK